MNKTRLFLPAVLLIVFSLLASACGPAKPSALSNDQVLALTAEILTAMDEGDYETFSREFSAEMLAAIPEAEFTELADMLHNTSGTFVSTGDMTLSNKQGYVLYRILCEFTLEGVVVTIVFPVGGSQVDGLFFDSPNLRTVSQ